MSKCLSRNIEELRLELYELYKSEGTIQSDKILKKSRELDKLILQHQKQKTYKSLGIQVLYE